MKPRKYGLALVLLLVAGSGCTGRNAVDNASSGSSDTGAEPAPGLTISPSFSDPVREETTPSTSEGSTVDVSPIELALGAVTDPELLAAKYQSAQIEFADSVSQCVLEEGFSGWIEPVPASPEASQLAAETRSPLPDLAEFGYGASVSLRGTFFTIATVPEDEVSPEDAYLAELPADQQETFIIAHATCVSKAMEVAPDPLLSMPAQIVEEIAEVRRAALESPEAVAVTNAWSVCMRSEGIAVSNRDDAIDLVWEKRVDAEAFLAEWLGTQSIPDDTDRDEFESLIAPVEEYEALVVSADLKCSQSVGETEIKRRVLWEAEEAWLDSNLDRVALLAAEEE